jgi:hypothetical protein
MPEHQSHLCARPYGPYEGQHRPQVVQARLAAERAAAEKPTDPIAQWYPDDDEEPQS